MTPDDLPDPTRDHLSIIPEFELLDRERFSSALAAFEATIAPPVAEVAPATASQPAPALAPAGSGWFSSWWGSAKPRAESVTKDEDSSLSKSSLRAYLGRLKKVLSEHEANLVKIQTARKQVRTKMQKELEDWTRFAIDSLYSMGTTYYTARMDRLTLLYDIEVSLCEKVSEAINEVQMILDGNLPLSSESIRTELNSDECKKSYKDIVAFLVERVDRAKVKECKALEDKLKELEVSYKETQKKALRPESGSERSRRLQALLNSGLESRIELLPPPEPAEGHGTGEATTSFYFHKANQRLQSEFKRIMCDERHTEGQIIKRWIATLREIIENRVVNPETITSFITSLSAEIIDKHHVPPANLLLECTMLYNQRLIYPQIQDVVHSMETPTEREKDQLFSKRVAKFRSQTQTQIGIDPQFQLTCYQCVNGGRPPANAKDAIPFANAIACLSRLEHDYVCSDMVYVVLKTIQMIYKQATSYASWNLKGCPNNHKIDPGVEDAPLPSLLSSSAFTPAEPQEPPLDDLFETLFQSLTPAESLQKTSASSSPSLAPALDDLVLHLNEPRSETSLNPPAPFEALDEPMWHAMEAKSGVARSLNGPTSKLSLASLTASSASVVVSSLSSSVSLATSLASLASTALKRRYSFDANSALSTDLSANAATSSSITDAPNTDLTDAATPAPLSPTLPSPASTSTDPPTTLATTLAAVTASSSSVSDATAAATMPTAPAATTTAASPTAAPDAPAAQTASTLTSIAPPTPTTTATPTATAATPTATVPTTMTATAAETKTFSASSTSAPSITVASSSPAITPAPPHEPTSPAPLNADLLFPIVVWVVVHSELTQVHRCLGFLERFLPEEMKSFGEIGMCLTLISAAVLHIDGVDVEPETPWDVFS